MAKQEIQDAHKLISQARTAHRLGSAVEYVCDSLERMLAWKNSAREVVIRVPSEDLDKAARLAAAISCEIRDQHDLRFSIMVIPE